MVTSRIILIVEDGNIIFKCIAESNMLHAKKVAAEIKKIPLKDLTINLLSFLCLDGGFGNYNDLVIISKNVCHLCIWSNHLYHIYDNKEKIYDQNFNHKLVYRLADYIEVVNY